MSVVLELADVQPDVKRLGDAGERLKTSVLQWHESVQREDVDGGEPPTSYVPQQNHAEEADRSDASGPRAMALNQQHEAGQKHPILSATRLRRGCSHSCCVRMLRGSLGRWVAPIVSTPSINSSN